MNLKVLSSSSEGNCYLLTSSGGSTLIIECGVPSADIKKALRFTLKDVAGCIVTHQHNDHARSVIDLLRYGITVYAGSEVFKSKGHKSPFACIVRPRQSFNVGEYKVTALQSFHDVPCLCYIVEHEEMGKLLFATDTYKLPYKVKDINHLMLECNYCDDVLEVREENGDCPSSLRERLMLTHMEKSTTKRVVEQNMCDSLQTIVLLHLSADNSCADEMRKCVLMASGRPTYIAEKGLELSLDIEPY